MTDVASQLQRAGFDGIAFACSRYRIQGGLRDHVHEYIHRPGGDPEKLGRKLYTIEMDAVFSTNTAAYPDAWPGDLSDLRDRFERQVTSSLIVPSVGSIQAYCIDWPIEMDFRRMRDGETAKLTFREDSSSELLIDTVVQVHFGALTPQFDATVLAAADAEVPTDLFSSIEKLVGEIEGLRGQIEMQGEIMRDRIQSLVVACQELEEQAEELADPRNVLVAQALRDLGYTAILLSQDILRLSRAIVPFEVPALMSILDVSTAVYGDAEKAMEILQMNAIDDAFSIPAGMMLRVYAPAPFDQV